MRQRVWTAICIVKLIDSNESGIQYDEDNKRSSFIRRIFDDNGKHCKANLCRACQFGESPTGAKY